jgi:beta-lactamase regulating signal transducer with metallopeptidase domain
VNAIPQFLTENGAMLLVGTTMLLSLGACALIFQRVPVHRQRIGELTILAVLFWLVLACLPLPRYSPAFSWLSTTPGEGTKLANRSVPKPESPTLSPETIPFAPTRQLDVASVPLPQLPVPTDSPELLLEELNRSWSHDVDHYDSTGSDESIVPMLFESVANSAAPNRLPPLTKANAEAEGPQVGFDVASTPPVVLMAARTRFDWTSLVVLVYLTGAVGCLGWLLLGRMLLARMVSHSDEPRPWLRELFESLGSQPQRPRLLISRTCRGALSYGIGRPTILLPEAICQPERTEQLRLVLLHELAHIQRHDAWSRLLFNLAFPLLYFHPLCWWIRSRVTLAAELIADDSAARHSSRVSYAEQLVALLRDYGNPQAGLICALQIFGSPSDFHRRIEMLMQSGQPLKKRCSIMWQLASCAVFGITLAIAVASVGLEGAQADPQPTASDEAAGPTTYDANASESLPEATGELPALDEKKSDSQLPTYKETNSFDDRVIKQRVREPKKKEPANDERQRLEFERSALKYELDIYELRIQGIREQLGKVLAADPVDESMVDKLTSTYSSLLQTYTQLSARMKQRYGQIALPSIRLEQRKAAATRNRDFEPGPMVDGPSPGVAIQQAASSARGPSAKERASALILQARIDLGKGRLNEARQKVIRAKKFKVKYGVFDDRPELVLEEIERIALTGQDEVARAIAEAEEKQARADDSVLPARHPRRPRTYSAPTTAQPTTLASVSQSTGRPDLVELATAYHDAWMNLELAQAEAERMEALGKKGVIAQRNMRIAAIKLKAAKWKRMMLHQIAEASLQAVRIEIDQLEHQLKIYKKRIEVGTVSPSDLTDFQPVEIQLAYAKANQKILGSMLADWVAE